MLRPGTVIGGKYRLDEQIGEGGMATIFRAVHIGLNRPVAVKCLRLFGEEARRLFLSEARAAAAVHHPNVVDIIDYGATDDGVPYIVMAHLEGETLAERFAGPEPLSVSDLVLIVSSALKGLAAVHEAGLVHRDLKPENIFLVRDTDGTLFPKLLDFGISCVAPGTELTVRSPVRPIGGRVFGTPHYMSPEQAQGRPDVDLRADLYGMGVILYEGLAGQLPFEGDDPTEVLTHIANDEPMPLAFVRPDLSGPLADVVTQAMAREREARFPDALAMRDALLAAAEATGVPVPIATLRPPPPEVLPQLPPPPRYPLMLRAEDITPMSSSMPPRRARTTFLFAATVGVLGAVLGLGFLAEEGGVGPWHEQPAAAAPAPEPEVVAEPAAAAEAEPFPATVAVRLEGIPEGAEVRVDGAPVRGGLITLARDERIRVIEVSAAGRTPWRIGHVAGADAVYSVVLEAAPVPVPAEVAPAPAAVEPPAREPRRTRRAPRMRAIPAAITPALPPPPAAEPPANPFESPRSADAPPLPSSATQRPWSSEPPPLPRLPDPPGPRGVPYEDPGF